MSQKADVVKRAGYDLGLTALNQGLQSEHNARISSAYNEVYDQLKSKGLAVWASTGDIPDKIVPHLIALICHNCLETYSVSIERQARIERKAGLNGELALRNIRDLVVSDYALPQDEPVDY